MIASDRDFDVVLMDIQYAFYGLILVENSYLNLSHRMPLLNGYEATKRIRALEAKAENPNPRSSHMLNGRLPIFAVSASLVEERREAMYNLGMDGWILKPIDFKRLRVILKGVTDVAQRQQDVYRPGRSWEAGGWLSNPKVCL